MGPALVAPDLRNNGLPLYLSRPFSRTEYVLGKMAVLVVLMSLITWIPGLLLFLFQGYLEGAGWLGANLRIGMAIFVGSWIWILVLSLVALALSAWVKWKPVARLTLLIVFFVLAGFAKAAQRGARHLVGPPGLAVGGDEQRLVLAVRPGDDRLRACRRRCGPPG